MHKIMQELDSKILLKSYDFPQKYVYPMSTRKDKQEYREKVSWLKFDIIGELNNISYDFTPEELQLFHAQNEDVLYSKCEALLSLCFHVLTMETLETENQDFHNAMDTFFLRFENHKRGNYEACLFSPLSCLADFIVHKPQGYDFTFSQWFEIVISSQLNSLVIPNDYFGMKAVDYFRRPQYCFRDFSVPLLALQATENKRDFLRFIREFNNWGNSTAFVVMKQEAVDDMFSVRCGNMESEVPKVQKMGFELKKIMEDLFTKDFTVGEIPIGLFLEIHLNIDFSPSSLSEHLYRQKRLFLEKVKELDL